MRGIKFGAVVSIMAVLLVGCSVTDTGNPRSQSSASTSMLKSTTSTSTVTFPPRPKEIRLDSIADVCLTLTKDQQRELGIDAAISEPKDIIEDQEMPGCRFKSNSRPLFNYNVTLVTNAGVGYWRGSGNLEVIEKTIAGYGALQVTLAGTTTGDCALAVDVADGQQLFVSFLPISDGFTQDQMCQNAAKGTEMVLATLQTLK